MAAWPARAAIAIAQPAMSCEAQAAASCTTTGVTTTSGSLFVASTSYCCDTFVSVTDSKLNSYSNAVPDQADGSGGSVRQDYKAAGTGGASHTFTVTGGSASFFASFSVFEVSGAASVSPLDQIAADTDTTDTNHSTPSTGTTSQANELLIGAGGTISTTTYTTDVGAGWTEGFNVTTDGDSEGIVTGYKVVSAIGTYAYTYTTGTSRVTSQVISTWKEAAVSAARQRCIGCGIDKKVIGQ